VKANQGLRWARAFIDQAKLDCDLAESLRTLVTDDKQAIRLGSNARLYTPAIYAYFQQAIEKALKALLWYETSNIPRKHNPLDAILKLHAMKERNRPTHLDVVFRNKTSLNKILNMAPGASSSTAKMEDLLRQPNTEYPFEITEGIIKLPCEEITDNDVATALKISKRLVFEIKKYLDSAELAPSNVL